MRLCISFPDREVKLVYYGYMSYVSKFMNGALIFSIITGRQRKTSSTEKDSHANTRAAQVNVRLDPQILFEFVLPSLGHVVAEKYAVAVYIALMEFP